jgi:hypothetical protein
MSLPIYGNGFISVLPLVGLGSFAMQTAIGKNYSDLQQGGFIDVRQVMQSILGRFPKKPGSRWASSLLYLSEVPLSRVIKWSLV